MENALGETRNVVTNAFLQTMELSRRGNVMESAFQADILAMENVAMECFFVDPNVFLITTRPGGAIETVKDSV